MSLLFETIKCQNRQLHNVQYHNFRAKQTCKKMFGIEKDFDFEKVIKIPDSVGSGLYRCRVSYSEEIGEIDFFPYDFKQPKIIQIIDCQSIKYDFKYQDRREFEDLLKRHPRADDVLITQNGFLTDTTYAHVAFFDGMRWFTPHTYLLPGTKRQFLIDNQLLIEEEITVKDLKKFQRISLINAMRDIDLSYGFELRDNRILIKS